MPFQHTTRKGWYLGLGGLIVLVLALPGASLYYHYSGGSACARCHEIWQAFTDWHTSTHRNVACSECHGDVFTLDAGFHLKNMHRVIAHLRGEISEQVRLKNDDVLKMNARCQKCHRQEFAAWSAGPHGATYTEIFLDPTHNRKIRMMDDCLRCHAMHFDGGIRDLVSPVNTTGPWRLMNSKLSAQPVMPCLSCHRIHQQGSPLNRPAGKASNPGPSQELFRPSLALFDRRERDYVPMSRLPLPVMHEGGRVVKISPDQRQALCYQCHAPLAAAEVGTGDDRTPVGVHEGLSCMACHQGHGQQTRASCSTCHPRLSNCGLDVETMDTSFKSRESKHNVHFVKCIDCHTKGVPKRKRESNVASNLPGPLNSGLM